MSTQTTEHTDSTGFRLSPQQELLFTADADQPGLSSQCAVRVDADEAQLRDSLSRLVARYEILRTVFVRAPGMRLPSQVIAERLEPEWQVDESADLDSALAAEA